MHFPISLTKLKLLLVIFSELLNRNLVELIAAEFLLCESELFGISYRL